MEFILVTTADERTWKFDRPILFLGEWCCLYERKHVWGNLPNAVIAKPFGVKNFERERDIEFVQNFTQKILVELTESLNKLHDTNHSVRYWKIVLGHWLQRYVSVAYNRYSAIEQTLEIYNVKSTIIFESNYKLATCDSSDFVWACNDDIWNHVFYSKILKFLGKINLEPDVNSIATLKGYKLESKSNVVPKRKIKQVFKGIAGKALELFNRDNDAFIINSYLPRKKEIKLQLSLGQFPQVWQSPAHVKNQVDSDMRKKFTINCNGFSGFELFLRNHLSEVIPMCFLEGYKRITDQVDSLPWPKTPKFIFTSNNFDTDEIFKVWTAGKTEIGIKYITGQHGNNYGTHICDGNSSWPERSASDRFVTWGWGDDKSKSIPGFIFKTLDKKPTFNPNGGVLLIQNLLPHRIYTYDNYFDYKLYQENQFRFVKGLPSHIHEHLTVRLHGAFRFLTWSDEKRWKDFDSKISLESGAVKIWDLIENSRLVVHSYDSTGILETLSLNIPTVCFWLGGFDHLLPEARPYYELLREAGILADSAEQAIEYVTTYWDNVSLWWRSEKVQLAREKFCNQYAKSLDNPVASLKKILTDK